MAAERRSSGSGGGRRSTPAPAPKRGKPLTKHERKKRARQAAKDARREDREDRILARKSVKLARVQAKAEDDYWGAESVAARQETLGRSLEAGIGAAGALAQTALGGGALDALDGLGDEEEGPIGPFIGDDGPNWFLIGGIGAAVVVVLIVVFAMTGKK